MSEKFDNDVLTLSRFVMLNTKSMDLCISLYFNMSNMLAHLSWNEIILLGVLIPSALNKILAPGLLKEMWPRLPNWFWTPCGLWEVAGVLFSTSVFAGEYNYSYQYIGLPLLYSFIGGVFSSIIAIKNDSGDTIISGKSNLGPMGFMPLVFASLTTYLISTIDTEHTSITNPALYATFGFGWGLFCASFYSEDKGMKVK